MYLQSISFESAFNGKLAAIFKGPEHHVRVGKKMGTQHFCTFGNLKDQEKQKLENEHKNPTELCVKGYERRDADTGIPQ